jgi:hypothetical protein
VVKRTVAATGYDDVSLADAALTEIGAPMSDRAFVASPRTANLMAGDLAKRGTFTGAVQNAYERATLGIDVAGFDVYKNDQSLSLCGRNGRRNDRQRRKPVLHAGCQCARFLGPDGQRR